MVEMEEAAACYLIAAGTAHCPFIEDGDLPKVKDAVKAIVDCLTSDVFGYRRVLPELGDNPTSTQLTTTLGEWFTDPARRATDKVIFYYAGHGETHQERHYLLTSDSRLKKISSTDTEWTALLQA